jgi:CxxC-x17-CxxC domain-containing protein
MKEQIDKARVNSEKANKQTSNSGLVDNFERKMFKATCSNCGTECEVPFEPTEGRDVKCKDCFRKNRPRKFGRNFKRKPLQMHDAKCTSCGKECQVPFKPREGASVLCKDCYIKSKESN